MKFGTIDFDSKILNALRDNTLVVFAGAGVSMGPPSNLPDFTKLTEIIAEGTGENRKDNEPHDRFLGRLKYNGINVHERAAHILSSPSSTPNTLHHDLLRLFRSKENVRLITTNFDCHFETEAKSLFGINPDIYQATALPVGREFNGIVHVHGSLNHPKDIVLTDADFGRAYLTQGWARRFLVDVFENYTVLFIGYSHNDVVMHYLSRALPVDNNALRFILTEEDPDDPKNEKWDILGIKPILFNKGKYSDLIYGVNRLAERYTRGELDWKKRVDEICKGAPPIDEEAIGEIEQALSEVYTTRLFIRSAKSIEWLEWMNEHKYLDDLFTTSELGERDILLVQWICENYIISQPNALFEIISTHGMKINQSLWWNIGRLLSDDNLVVEKSILEHWITVLLSCAPQHNREVLAWLAKQCIKQGSYSLLLSIFLFLLKPHFILKKGFTWNDSEGVKHGRPIDVDFNYGCEYWSLNEVWENYIKPNISIDIQPLLTGVVQYIEEMRQIFFMWGQAKEDWDPLCYSRSAIEPHEQDNSNDNIDLIIDVARDLLEWLAINNPSLLDCWINKMVKSEAPLLRRLAIHAVAKHLGMTANDRLYWLTRNFDLNRIMEHHEIWSVVANNYPNANLEARKAFIDTVYSYQLPARSDITAEENTARFRFNWFSWLVRAKNDDTMAQTLLEPITKEYPHWRLSEHPDFTHWISTGSVGPQSPWTADQLLEKKPEEQLHDLMTYKGEAFHGPDRDGLIEALKDACKKDTDWAFALAEILQKNGEWTSDLWPALFRGWQEASLSVVDWLKVLDIIKKPELIVAYQYDLANLLYSLVKNEESFDQDLLEQANIIASLLWENLVADKKEDDVKEWLQHAINDPGGVIVEFWLNGLSLLMKGKTGVSRIIPENYKQWFEKAIQDITIKGGFGRTILTSQMAFLYGVDEKWARENVLPLFSERDIYRFNQAWDGFLTWGRFTYVLAGDLLPAFISAISRLDSDLQDDNNRSHFIDFYTDLTVYHVDDPTQQMIPALFKNNSLKDRISFTSRLGEILRHMEQSSRQQLWNRWLRKYWQDRLESIPAKLEQEEIKNMLDWLPNLGDLFPEAVMLAVKSERINQLDQSSLLYRLRKTDFATQYPNEMTELIIYLCRSKIGYHIHYIKEIVEHLPKLPDDLKRRLDEALIRIGLV